MRWLARLLLMLLSGCSVPFKRTSIEQQINQEIRHPGATVLAGPDIRLIKQMLVGTAVLYTYQSEQDGQMRRWSSILFFEQGPTGWTPTSGSGSGIPIDQQSEPIEFGSGTSNGDRTYSFARGLVADPSVTSVLVRFCDNSQQSVPVENGAYVVATLGGAHVTNIDAPGNVIHQLAGR